MRKNVGIIGAGNIAGHMADTINAIDDISLYAIASRDYEKAVSFAEKYNVEKAYGSYEELVMDDNIDLVYIATPHSHHFEHMKLCIEKGKHVLCEKAFTANAKEAEEILSLAENNNVLVAEAIWTRYMPSRRIIDEILSKKVIGDICSVTCNLSYDIDQKERLIRPELAGGALLDIGVYGLNFIVMHLGKNIKKIDSTVIMTDTGVDGQESITFVYNDGRMASTTHSIYGRSDRQGIFVGESGYIIIDNINNPLNIVIYDSSDKVIDKISVPEQISGYEYEVIECFDALAEGKIECASMPHDETIYIMQMMDNIKKSWN